MSGLAHVLLARGVKISGSDPHENAATRRLEAIGARIYRRQEAENIAREQPALIVATAAIHEDNPELGAAREAGLPVLSRAELLGRVMAEHGGPRIAITGTHGKTTTTAMTAAILLEAGLDPSILVGGEYPAIGGNVRVGKGEAFLTEACEAYDSFLSLAPDIAVVTNVEADHLDYFGTEENVFRSFEQFLSKISAGGTVIWCTDDPGVRRLRDGLAQTDLRAVEYGIESGVVRAENVRDDGVPQRFTLVRIEQDGEPRSLAEIELHDAGRHKLLDAVAAAAVGLEIGAAPEVIARALTSFRGTERRFERLGERDGVEVIDDYAHHPTEIRTTLAAARSAYPGKRLIAAFQPHLYSRTRDFLPEFAEALGEADVIVVADIYAAREDPIPGVRAADIVRELARVAPDRSAMFQSKLSDVTDALRCVARSGDVVITLGAGNIRTAAENYLEECEPACR